MSVAKEAQVYNLGDPDVRKYAQSPSTHLEAFIQLDLDIYQNLQRLFPPGVEQVDNDLTQSLVLGYLQDFKETAYNDVTDAEAAKELSGNPLAVYRAFWRFENYIKKSLKHSAKYPGTDSHYIVSSQLDYRYIIRQRYL